MQDGHRLLLNAKPNAQSDLSCVQHNMLHPSSLEAIAHGPLQQNTAQTRMTTPVLMSESDLPDIGLTTGSVFTIRSSISIDAPKQKVWDVILDFASYREWRVGPYFMMGHRLLNEGPIIQESIHVCFNFFLGQSLASQSLRLIHMA